jgi:hypothetical protein
MTKEELQKIIDSFDEETLKKQGIFGISEYGDGSDESFIRANKQGLELFALELLKSARDSEMILSSKEQNIITLNYEEDWIDENSDTLIQYIEPIADNQKMSFGCSITVIILIISIITGFRTIIDWLF